MVAILGLPHKVFVVKPLSCIVKPDENAAFFSKSVTFTPVEPNPLIGVVRVSHVTL